MCGKDGCNSTGLAVDECPTSLSGWSNLLASGGLSPLILIRRASKMSMVLWRRGPFLCPSVPSSVLRSFVCSDEIEIAVFLSVPPQLDLPPITWWYPTSVAALVRQGGEGCAGQCLTTNAETILSASKCTKSCNVGIKIFFSDPSKVQRSGLSLQPIISQEIIEPINRLRR